MKVNRVLTIPEPRRFEIIDRPYPEHLPGYAVVRTEIAPICLEGTRIWDRHEFEFHDDPTHLGHEGVGTIEAVHPGSSFRVGDRVIVFQGDHCGQCHACRQALSPTYCDANVPERGGRALIGIEERNGSASGGFAMATHRLAPLANLYRIPDEVSFKHAAASNCSYGVGFSNQEAMGVRAGDTVLIGGVGFISMGHVISALYRNATVIALIRNPYRQALLHELGVAYFVNPDDPEWLTQVRALTYDQQGVDHAVDGSGAAFYQERMLKALRNYGTLNLSGHIPDELLKLNTLEQLLDGAKSIWGQHDVRIQDRQYLVRSLRDPEVQRMIDVMVTHEFPMSNAGEAFDLQVTKRCGKIYLHTQQ